jgi:hypothetical protein
MALNTDHEDAVSTTAADTLEFLETRLRRIEFLLTGSSSWSGESVSLSRPPVPAKDSATARLASLEHDLRRLSSSVPVVRDVMRLCTLFLSVNLVCSRFSDLTDWL